MVKAPLPAKKAAFSAVCCALTLCLLTALARPDPLRLHVLANSDSPRDQAVKLEVRDAVLQAVQDVTSAHGLTDAKTLVMAHGAELQTAAEAVLAQNGLAYGAQLYLGPSSFPDRTYGSTIYPAGEYEALRVVLGEGAGQNWWCVIYPPLCLAAEEPAEEVEFRSIFAVFFDWIFGKL